MRYRLSKLLCAVLAILLIFATIAVPMTNISYAADTSTNSISLKNGWYPCDDKGKKIAPTTTFTYDNPSKIDIKPIQRITNGKTILVIDKENDVSVNYLWNTSTGKAFALIHGKGKYKDAFIFVFPIALNQKKATNTNAAKTTNTNTAKATNTNANKNATANTAKATNTTAKKTEVKKATPKKIRINMNNVDVSVSQETRVYNGKPYEPQPTVKYKGKALRKDTDYTVTWKNNVYVGTATITVTGKGDYEGAKNTSFKISQLAVNNLAINKSSVILYEGQNKQLLGTVDPFSLYTYGLVQWTSSNNAVARVNNSGMVTAVGGGTAYIKIQAMDGTGRCGQCKVVVKTGQDIVNEARKAKGVKYVWGGESFTKGMDCSGLVVVVYKRVLGVKLPHFTGSLEKSKKFKTIKASELRPGDILVRYGPGHKSGKHIRHTGIWTGKGIIEESGGDGKCIESNKASKVKSWKANYTARRYVG